MSADESVKIVKSGKAVETFALLKLSEGHAKELVSRAAVFLRFLKIPLQKQQQVTIDFANNTSNFLQAIQCLSTVQLLHRFHF